MLTDFLVDKQHKKKKKTRKCLNYIMQILHMQNIV